ncbi:hypothetical protein GSI_11029 [Ganoderma sinense ZZ0214-1]|uniref:Uncharacterized protein n=1 Tax=Ganoderma sinense ZZ0214-1 TaxID=1077348 RepID=A0A2G8RZA2_9APHY|nr:hypothetical protein GSI_11029 [Ganoderma sinense ZZ0214-1]
MNQRIPGWVRDAYDRLWSRSEDFTAERRGLTVLTCPPPSNLGQRVIAVRDDYLQLWDFLKDAHHGKHHGGIVLTGHPGAGKFCFLLYAFARALREHVPVAFCNSPDEYYYCDRTGCRLYPTHGLVLHEIKLQDGKFSLVLVASSESVPIPPYKFINTSQMCFTVQATSPQSALLRCGRWVREREASYWVIQPWSEDEVRKLQHFYEEEPEGPHPWKNNDAYYSPLETFALLGPSIRKCFCAHGNRKTAHGPAHDFEAFLRPDDIFDDMDDFVDGLREQTMASLRPGGPDFHRLFVASKPWDISNPMRYSLLFHHAVPTLFLQRLLAARFRRRTTSEQVALVSNIPRIPQLKGLSFVYDPAILDLLCRPQRASPSAPCGPSASASASPSTTTTTTNGHVLRGSQQCQCHLADGTAFTLGPGLALASEEEVTPSTPSVALRDNHVYLLRSGSGFPWIDAFVVTVGEARPRPRTRVTLLQTTVCYRREVVSSAVRRVVELVRRSTPAPDPDPDKGGGGGGGGGGNGGEAIEWSFVFVTPSGRGEKMAKTVGEVQFRGRDWRHPAVVAGWLEVGALLGYAPEVVDALKRQDAESVGEHVDDDAELATHVHKATRLDSGCVDWDRLPPGGSLYGGP